MAFKTVKSYNEEKFGGYFLLRNDNDFADVIFLYQNSEDVLVADVHYIKSNDYSGYVHCCGKGCPACAKGIRTQPKLFIPLFNIAENEIQFFDRTMRFEPQLQQDVFSKYPNPSEYVFRITRHGAAGSVDTTYEIQAIGKNSSRPYFQILAEHNAIMPDYYNTICKEVSNVELQSMLDSRGNNGYSPNEEYSYTPTPRASAPSEPVTVPTPEYSAPSEYIPDPSVTDVTDDSDDLGEPEF